MDLLLGLCRASLFTHGAEYIKPMVARSVEHAVSTADSAGLGRALLFQYMSDFVVEEGIPKEVQRAYDLSKSTKDRNLEIFAIYHIAEHYLYDKYDLVNTKKWLSYGLNRLTPDVNPKHRGNLYKVSGLYQESNGNRDSMSYWLDLAQVEFKRVGDYVSPTLGRLPSGNWDQGMMNLNHVLCYQGRNALTQGNFTTAQTKFTEALSIAQKSEVSQTLSRTLGDIGELQTAQGDIEGAIESYSAALEIHKAQQSKLYASYTAQRIGYLFLLVEDGKAARRFYQLASEDATAISDTIEMANSLLGLTRSAEFSGDVSAADQFLVSAISLAKQSKDTITLSYLQSEQALQIFKRGRLEEAKDAYKASILLHERYNHSLYIQTDYLGLARSFLALDQLDSALAIMPRVEEIVIRTGTIHKQQEVAELYAKIAEAATDLPLAILQHKRIQAINDSLNKQNGQTSLRREEVRQNVDDIRQENEALARERELIAQRSKLYLALALALLLLLSIGGYLFFRLRKTQGALSDRNDQLKALNATKDRFFGIIAHDIRSPIIALDGVGDQLRYFLDKGRTERATDLADNVGQTASRLSRLLDQLLNWALLQQGTMPHNPEPLQLAEVLEEVLELFGSAAATKGITLDYSVPADLSLRADPAGLRTMLRNLVSNAIKFTPRGGRVTLSGGQDSNGQLILEVRDDGIGMEKDRITTILSGERQTDRGTAGERGSGLGLRLVRELAELHKADLSVMSESGSGSCFRLTFPS